MRKFKWEKEIRTIDKSRQQKKHYTQMNKEELDYLHKELIKSMRSDKYYKISPKLEMKISEERIKIHIQDLVDVIQEAEVENIIEYNETLVRGKVFNRVLYRSSKVYKVNGNIDANLCVVYSLTDKTFVTAYFNDVRDMHQTLREEIYSKDLKIIK